MTRPSTLAVSALLLACVSTFAFPVHAGKLADSSTESMGEPVFEDAPPVPVFTWTGAYAGVQVGYGFGRDRVSAMLPGGPLRLDLAPSGIMGGGHIGYLLSTQSLPALGPSFVGADTALVGGLEADIDGAARDAHAHHLPTVGGLAVRSDLDGSIRGRLGVAAKRVLVYATGGLALETVDTASGDDRTSRTRVGTTVGGGVEYAILNTVSVRAEYRYSDFGHFTDLVPGGGLVLPVDHHDTTQRLQAGLSYRFGSPAMSGAGN